MENISCVALVCRARVGSAICRRLCEAGIRDSPVVEFTTDHVLHKEYLHTRMLCGSTPERTWARFSIGF